MDKDSTRDSGGSKNISVMVKNVSLMYNLSRQREERLKEYVINMFKGKLFFDPFWALNNVSFKLKKGESLGIVGRNGAGKSSLLKIVSGIIKPTEGKIYTQGVISPMIELGGGFDPNMSAKENVFFSGAMHGFSKKYMQERFDAIIEFAELQEFADVPVKNFSSGMGAKLSFAIATFIDPDILIADEAMSVGDIGFNLKCEKRLEEIAGKGATVIIVSHYMEQIKKMCEKTLWLERGNMMMFGETKEVCGAYEKFMAERSAETGS